MTAVDVTTGEMYDGSGDWETTREEFGETVQFTEAGQTFIGEYESVSIVNLPDPNNPGEMRDSNAYAFRVGEKKYTVWGSYNIDAGMAGIPIGKTVRIQFVQRVAVKGKSPIAEYRIAYKK